MGGVRGLIAQSDGPGFFDDEVLNEFTIPFGEWIKQAVNWTVLNLGWLLDAIEWPFRTLIDVLVNDFLTSVSWVVVVAMMFLVAWLARNLKVAIGVAMALTMCGLLGANYWLETARTIGYIFVAVVLCVIIGIPVGILCGRSDATWRVVRPVLDAMQVVHSFVYMLPFMYFWGIGPVPATMVTMIFAIPPLIRLTNLGIRQVPEDVVEASLAFGAPEFRVLTDVQVPLARPAIMTGINQTLLLAISMLGIAAILGSGGLGALLFRAITNQNVALAASAGLAFFLVAVVLDRISQPESDQGGNLLSRIAAAWRSRRDPAQLLIEREAAKADAPVDDAVVDYVVGATPMTSSERAGIGITVVGTVLALVSVLLPWSEDASKISSYSRRADEDLTGQTFNGLSATGGSWFGIVIALVAVWAIVACVNSLVRPGGGPRWLSPDGAVIATSTMLVTAIAFWYASPPDVRVNSDGTTEPLVYSDQIGVYLAVGAGVVALGGAVWWMMQAPRVPRTPLKPNVAVGRLIGGVAAILLAVVSMFSAWSFDERQDLVITPELEAEMEEIREAVDAGEIQSAVGAAQITALRNQATREDALVLDGKTSAGAGLGVLTLGLVGLGVLMLLPGAGVFGLDDRRQWYASTLSVGVGVGVGAIAVGWIGSLTRATDSNVVSGIGSFLAMIAGGLLVASSAALVAGYERTKVYVDDLEPVPAAPTPDRELVTT